VLIGCLRLGLCERRADGEVNGTGDGEAKRQAIQSAKHDDALPKQEARILRQAAALICPLMSVTGRERPDLDPEAFDPDSRQVAPPVECPGSGRSRPHVSAEQYRPAFLRVSSPSSW
jgi:hypothetical protein